MPKIFFEARHRHQRMLQIRKVGRGGGLALGLVEVVAGAEPEENAKGRPAGGTPGRSGERDLGNRTGSEIAGTATARVETGAATVLQSRNPRIGAETRGGGAIGRGVVLESSKTPAIPVLLANSSGQVE